MSRSGMSLRDGGSAAPESPLTIGAALAAARARLAASGSPSAALDARILLGAITGLDTTALVSRPDAAIAAEDLTRFEALVDRRAGGEPVARILCIRDFWGFGLEVDGSTLVPRPDTEVLVEAVLDAVPHLSCPGPITICDLGTGTGAILIALLNELPSATGIGIDTSPGAVDLAERNARTCGVSERSRFAVADFARFDEGPFDIVVSNPPYVASGDIAGLDRDVRDWDPRLALDGGSDGLDAYRIIAARAKALLKPGGLIAVEVGAGQDEAVASLFRSAGLTHRETRADLSGVPRVVACLCEAGG